ALIGEAELALLAVDRRDVDDAAKAPLAHAVDHRTGLVEHRVEIGADHLLPLLVRHLLEHGVARDAGVVDQRLDGTHLVLDINDPLLGGGVVAHVPLEHRDLGFLVEGLGRLVVAAVIGGDVIARRLQCLSDGGTNAARTSRDESNPSHAFLPWTALLRRPLLHSASSCRPRAGHPRTGSGPIMNGRDKPGHDAVLLKRHSRSTHMAMPMPPPMQSVARPFLASRFCISCSRVVRIRAPEAPIGWPMAIAPPLTFTLLASQPMSLFTASAWAAKASLASTRSRSLMAHPAFSSALREAGMGPEPMILGSTPAVAQEAMRARGLSF